MNKVTLQRQAKRYYERYGNRATFFRVLRYLWHRPHLTLAIPALITLGFFSGQAGVIALILIFLALSDFPWSTTRCCVFKLPLKSVLPPDQAEYDERTAPGQAGHSNDA